LKTLHLCLGGIFIFDFNVNIVIDALRGLFKLFVKYLLYGEFINFFCDDEQLGGV